MAHAETDIPPWRYPPAHLRDIDASPSDVFCRAVDYPTGRLIPPHRHAKHQLIHAVRGLMVVTAEQGRWVVPSTRALWMPAGWEHSVRLSARCTCAACTSARRPWRTCRGARPPRWTSARCCAS